MIPLLFYKEAAVKGKLSLEGCELERKSDLAFTVSKGPVIMVVCTQCLAGELFEFSTKSNPDCAEWCKCLLEAIKWSNEQAKKPDASELMVR